MRPLKIFTVLFVVFVSGFSETAIADGGWILRKDSDNIQVYTKQVEGSSYDAVKAITILFNVRLDSLVALIQDVEACADWADKCAQSYVYERLSDTEAYVYTHNSLPFPIKDRDVLAHVTWSQDPLSYEINMHSEATMGIMAEVKGWLRLTQANASWRFRPLASGGVEVRSEAHLNPGSSLPGWVTNMLLVDTPYQTMKSFAAEVAMPKYRNALVNFIKEPPEL